MIAPLEAEHFTPFCHLKLWLHFNPSLSDFFHGEGHSHLFNLFVLFFFVLIVIKNNSNGLMRIKNLLLHR